MNNQVIGDRVGQFGSTSPMVWSMSLQLTYFINLLRDKPQIQSHCEITWRFMHHRLYPRYKLLSILEETRIYLTQEKRFISFYIMYSFRTLIRLFSYFGILIYFYIKLQFFDCHVNITNNIYTDSLNVSFSRNFLGLSLIPASLVNA